ncbi:MAG: nucleotide sugar dehydrogenase, partial [Patescibacteria group bacterium]|nr:nucleotide sugar dehydrogenase [Patescibacteria group bacterium]
STPEFLREGQAISDTLHPDRIVVGADSDRAKNVLAELHKPIDGTLILTNVETAEMIKYAANAFLATKISFANTIARLSEITGADGPKVLEAVGLDKRVGSAFLNAGAGFGGSCFPKDVRALIAIARQNGYDFNLLTEVTKINRESMLSIVEKAKKLLKNDVNNKKVCVFGLAFKPDTDDMRDAPSITIIDGLQKSGAQINVYDPIAIDNARKLIKNVNFCKDPYSAAKGCDLLIILTEWNEFRQLDLGKIKQLMKQPIILDGRNIYDPDKIKRLGFFYQGVGR